MPRSTVATIATACARVYMCVCACLRACAAVWMCVYVRARGWARAGVCGRVGGRVRARAGVCACVWVGVCGRVVGVQTHGRVHFEVDVSSMVFFPVAGTVLPAILVASADDGVTLRAGPMDVVVPLKVSPLPTLASVLSLLPARAAFHAPRAVQLMGAFRPRPAIAASERKEEEAADPPTDASPEFVCIRLVEIRECHTPGMVRTVTAVGSMLEPHLGAWSPPPRTPVQPAEGVR